MVKVNDVELRLTQLDINLPDLPKQSGNYLLGKRSGNSLYISGSTCKLDGKILYKGKVGEVVTVEEGYDAAKICALNLLAVIKSITGDLNKVKDVIKIVGYVNCNDNFGEIPTVINGASDLFIQIYGERGKHTRCAVGVSNLPGFSAVEIDIVVELKS